MKYKVTADGYKQNDISLNLVHFHQDSSFCLFAKGVRFLLSSMHDAWCMMQAESDNHWDSLHFQRNQQPPIKISFTTKTHKVSSTIKTIGNNTAHEIVSIPVILYMGTLGVMHFVNCILENFDANSWWNPYN